MGLVQEQPIVFRSETLPDPSDSWHWAVPLEAVETTQGFVKRRTSAFDPLRTLNWYETYTGMRVFLFRSIAVLLMTGAAACGPDGSVIYDKQPFFSLEADFSAADRDAFLQASCEFATGHGFEAAVNDLGLGRFNVFISDATPATINIIASTVVTRGEMEISVYSRNAPTPDQSTIAQEYVSTVSRFIRNPRPIQD